MQFPVLFSLGACSRILATPSASILSIFLVSSARPLLWLHLPVPRQRSGILGELLSCDSSLSQRPWLCAKYLSISESCCFRYVAIFQLFMAEWAHHYRLLHCGWEWTTHVIFYEYEKSIQVKPSVSDNFFIFHIWFVSEARILILLLYCY